MRHNVRSVVMDVITFLENLKTTSGLLILLHGVIPLSGATSYDKTIYIQGRRRLLKSGTALERHFPSVDSSG